jgi:hypothetical protein
VPVCRRALRRAEEAGRQAGLFGSGAGAALEVTVGELRSRGIVFEEYDLPGVKTVDGIADHESGARGAWFKDPDGNILQIGQYSN